MVDALALPAAGACGAALLQAEGSVCFENSATPCGKVLSDGMCNSGWFQEADDFGTRNIVVRSASARITLLADTGEYLAGSSRELKRAALRRQRLSVCAWATSRRHRKAVAGSQLRQ